MFKHFHTLFGRRNAIDLNKSFDSLENSASVIINTKDSKKNSEKDNKKKSTKRSYGPSDDELTEKVVTPPEDHASCPPCDSSSPRRKQNSRKLSMDNFFNHSGASRRRSRTASKLSTTFTEDFWDRHFPGQRFASWQEFRAAFLEDYGALIEDFAPDRTHWLLAIVHEDIFRDMDDVYRYYYERFCKKHDEGDRLWMSIKEYASERIFREGVVESMLE